MLIGNRSARADTDTLDATTPDGRALRFYASVRLQVQVRGAVRGSNEVIGSRVRLTAVKNKVAPPFRTTDLQLVYGRGFCKRAPLLEDPVDEEPSRSGAESS